MSNLRKLLQMNDIWILMTNYTNSDFKLTVLSKLVVITLSSIHAYGQSILIVSFIIKELSSCRKTRSYFDRNRPSTMKDCYKSIDGFFT